MSQSGAAQDWGSGQLRSDVWAAQGRKRGCFRHYGDGMDQPDGVAAAIAYDLGGTPPVWFAAGAWSTAYALDLDSEPVVLRVGRHGEDFAKDAIIASAVTDLPVPAVHTCGERDGWAYALSARATGTPLDDLDAAGMEAVLPDLLDVMDRIGR